MRGPHWVGWPLAVLGHRQTRRGAQLHTPHLERPNNGDTCVAHNSNKSNNSSSSSNTTFKNDWHIFRGVSVSVYMSQCTALNC